VVKAGSYLRSIVEDAWLRKGKLMNSRTGLFIAAVGVAVCSSARAANVRPGSPQLLDACPAIQCVVPATFQSGNLSSRVLFVNIAGSLYVKRDNQPLRLLTARATLKGGEQRPSGVYLATSYGLMYSGDGSQLRYLSSASYMLVSPFGWAKDSDGLWKLADDGSFSRVNLPIAPWRNVIGFAPSTNYLYGPNLIWVGTSATYFPLVRGLYQAVFVNGHNYPALGLPDFQRVTAVCGITGGHYMVYSGMIYRHRAVADPFAPLYEDTGMPVDSYSLQSLQYGPNDVDAVAYVGRTLWLNLGSQAPTSVFMPGAIRNVAVDTIRRELIVSTAAGLFTVPYALGS
jgi:hypothetical protein